MDDFTYAELLSPPRSVTDQHLVDRTTTIETIGSPQDFLHQVKLHRKELTDEQRRMFSVVAFLQVR